MLDVTVHYTDGTHRAKRMQPEDAMIAMRELCFRLGACADVVSVTITKSDPVTRLIEGRLKLAPGGDGA